MSGSSAGATTTFAAASTRHPSLRAFFAQAGGSSIYDDVIYEGQAIEMERLWLWVAKNIPGLSAWHRETVMARFGIGATELDRTSASAAERYNRLDAARQDSPPFVNSPDWLRLPLAGYPDFSIWQPFLDEIITHPTPDAFRARHNFRRTNYAVYIKTVPHRGSPPPSVPRELSRMAGSGSGPWPTCRIGPARW